MLTWRLLLPEKHGAAHPKRAHTRWCQAEHWRLGRAELLPWRSPSFLHSAFGFPGDRRRGLRRQRQEPLTAFLRVLSCQELSLHLDCALLTHLLSFPHVSDVSSFRERSDLMERQYLPVTWTLGLASVSEGAKKMCAWQTEERSSDRMILLPNLVLTLNLSSQYTPTKRPAKTFLLLFTCKLSFSAVPFFRCAHITCSMQIGKAGRVVFVCSWHTLLAPYRQVKHLPCILWTAAFSNCYYSNGNACPSFLPSFPFYIHNCSSRV